MIEIHVTMKHLGQLIIQVRTEQKNKGEEVCYMVTSFIYDCVSIVGSFPLVFCGSIFFGYVDAESFELMRREQQKALQEKQNNHKHNLDADIITLLENSADKKSIISKTDKAEDSSLSKVESPRSSTMHAPLSRPLVPPGFASAAVDKILPVQSNCIASEVLTIFILVSLIMKYFSLRNGYSHKNFASVIAIRLHDQLNS